MMGARNAQHGLTAFPGRAAATGGSTTELRLPSFYIATSGETFDFNSLAGQPNEGTTKYAFHAHHEYDTSGNIEVFQTITFHARYDRYSLEELRLADYAASKQYGTSGIGHSTVRSSSSGLDSAVFGENLVEPAARRNGLALLQGPSVDIVIGRFRDPGPAGTSKTVLKQFSLPMSLVSHHSSFLKERCDEIIMTGGRREISLHLESPDDLVCLVEFMHWGNLSLLPSAVPTVETYAMLWRLGRNMEAVRFQNLVMRHLYRRLIPPAGHPPVHPLRPADVRYVCEITCVHTTAGLRKFVLDVMVNYFTDMTFLSGTAQEWDQTLQLDLLLVSISLRD